MRVTPEQRFRGSTPRLKIHCSDIMTGEWSHWLCVTHKHECVVNKADSVCYCPTSTIYCMWYVKILTNTLTKSALPLRGATCGDTGARWCCQASDRTPGDWLLDRGSWGWRPTPRWQQSPGRRGSGSATRVISADYRWRCSAQLLWQPGWTWRCSPIHLKQNRRQCFKSKSTSVLQLLHKYPSFCWMKCYRCSLLGTDPGAIQCYSKK